MNAMLRLLSLLAVLLAASVPAQAEDRRLEVQLNSRPALPVLTMLDGKTVDPASLRGKVVVLSYFSSDCPFCMNEAPKLQKLYHDNRDKLIVIGINIEFQAADQRQRASAWIKKYGWQFPVTTDFQALERVLGKRKGLPVNYIFDKQGVLKRVDIGEIFDEDFDDIASFARRE